MLVKEVGFRGLRHHRKVIGHMRIAANAQVSHLELYMLKYIDDFIVPNGSLYSAYKFNSCIPFLIENAYKMRFLFCTERKYLCVINGQPCKNMYLRVRRMRKKKSN